MIIPETELAFRRMENGTKPFLIAMLEMAIPPFGRMEKEIKVPKLLGKELIN
jgi:hypothetical protein